MADFVIVMAQGRSGSTAILRMLNAVPGVHIAGENEKAIDHLRSFLDCFERATTHHHSEFFRLAWSLPCSIEALQQKTSAFLQELYNPGNAYRLAGFKEIRYGRDYDQLCQDIEFLRRMFPNLKLVFNTRETDDAVKSEFWRDDPKAARRMLDLSRENFERYQQHHPQWTYLLPYEQLHEGSQVLHGMFDFLNIEFTAAARAQLQRRLK